MSSRAGDAIEQALRRYLARGNDDLEVVRDVVEHHLGELLQFADTVRKRIDE